MNWRHWVYTLPLRLRSIFRRVRVEQELDDELRFHLEQQVLHGIASGRSREDARRSALLAMGGMEQRKEECRDTRHTNWIDSTVRDLRYGLRVLRKKPSFFLIASLTLGLGIGIATTLFSVTESQLWRPLPFAQSERLAVVWKHKLDQQWARSAASPSDFLDWRDRTRSFESLAAIRWPEQRNFSARGVTERSRVAGISTGFFATLRTKLIAGATFDKADEYRGHGQKAIVSSSLARRVFGSAMGALGKIITLDGAQFVVSGILPDGLQLEFMRTPDIFVPLTIEHVRYNNEHRRDGVEVVGRLRDGIDINQAQQELQAIAQQIAIEHPKTNQGWGVYVENLRASVAAPYRTSLLLYFGFSLFVLAIACANVAGLQLVRGLQRQREFAVREALGAGRQVLLRQSLGESLWIAIAGCTLGVLFSSGGMQAIHSLPLEHILPRPNGVSLNFWAVVFAVGVAFMTSLCFGLAPGLSSSRTNLELVLRESAKMLSGSKSIRLRMEALVVAEVALAFISLFGAGLFVSSNWEIQHIAVGFNPHRIVTIQIPLGGSKYSDRQKRIAFYQQVSNEINSTLGVRRFAISNGLPLHSAGDVTFAKADGSPAMENERHNSLCRIITPAYFRLLGIPLLQGRAFTDRDSSSAPYVAIINQNLARHYFGGENPIGKELVILPGSDAAVREGKVEIVGLAANSKEVGPNEVDFDDIYFPFMQASPASAFVLFETATPGLVAPLLRKKIQNLDTEEFVAPAVAMDWYVANALHGGDIKLIFVSAFASLALLLTTIGIYGTISFAVAQRTREFGLRVALGARPGRILQMAIYSTLRVVMLGSAIGVTMALVLGEMFRSALYMAPHEHEGILYKVNIHDPLSLTCAAGILVMLGIAAGLAPGIKAAAADPWIALR